MINVPRRMGHARLRDRLALEARRARGPLLVCLAAVAAAAAAAAVILSNINFRAPWEEPQRLRVALDSANGIVTGKQEVRRAGVVIGTIDDVQVEDGRAVATITYDGDQGELYRDARLRLRPQTPLDDMYLDVESAGDPGAGRIEKDAVLSAERTRVPVDVADVLNAFDEGTRDRMEKAIDELGAGLPDGGVQLRASFASIAPFLGAAERLTREFAIRSEATRRMMHNFRRMTDELARRDSALAGLVARGDATFGALADARDPLEELIAAVPATMAAMQTSFDRLDTTLDVLDPALSDLRPAARAMPRGLRALRRLAGDAAPAFRELRSPVKSLSRLAAQLRPTSQALQRAFERLLPQAPRYDRITRRVSGCELAVDKFFQWTPSVLKYADVNGAYPRGNNATSSSSVAPGAPDVALRPHPGCTTGKEARP